MPLAPKKQINQQLDTSRDSSDSSQQFVKTCVNLRDNYAPVAKDVAAENEHYVSKLPVHNSATIKVEQSLYEQAVARQQLENPRFIAKCERSQRQQIINDLRSRGKTDEHKRKESTAIELELQYDEPPPTPEIHYPRPQKRKIQSKNQSDTSPKTSCPSNSDALVTLEIKRSAHDQDNSKMNRKYSEESTQQQDTDNLSKAQHDRDIINSMRPRNQPVAKQIQMDVRDSTLPRTSVPFYMQPRKHYPRKLDDSFLYSKIDVRHHAPPEQEILNSQNSIQHAQAVSQPTNKCSVTDAVPVNNKRTQEWRLGELQDKRQTTSSSVQTVVQEHPVSQGPENKKQQKAAQPVKYNSAPKPQAIKISMEKFKESHANSQSTATQQVATSKDQESSKQVNPPPQDDKAALARQRELEKQKKIEEQREKERKKEEERVQRMLEKQRKQQEEKARKAEAELQKQLERQRQKEKEERLRAEQEALLREKELRKKQEEKEKARKKEEERLRKLEEEQEKARQEQARREAEEELKRQKEAARLAEEEAQKQAELQKKRLERKEKERLAREKKEREKLEKQKQKELELQLKQQQKLEREQKKKEEEEKKEKERLQRKLDLENSRKTQSPQAQISTDQQKAPEEQKKDSPQPQPPSPQNNAPLSSNIPNGANQSSPPEQIPAPRDSNLTDNQNQDKQRKHENAQPNQVNSAKEELNEFEKIMAAQNQSTAVNTNVVIAQPPPENINTGQNEQFDIFDMNPEPQENGALDMLLEAENETDGGIANQKPQDYYLGSLNWGTLEQ